MANINIFNGFLKAFIRAEAEFENDKIPELLKGEFIFALSNDSSTNLAAVDKICKKMGFMRPSNRRAISPIKRNYFQLREPKQLLPWARSKRKHSDDLFEISRYPDISKKLKIIPVDVYWGKGAEILTAQTSGFFGTQLIMIFGFILLLYFLLIRPQNKRNKEIIINK